jgi:hypothetical protein
MNLSFPNERLIAILNELSVHIQTAGIFWRPDSDLR